MSILTSLWHLAEHIYLQIFILCYVTLQNILSLVFAPTPPPPQDAAKLHRPRIAIIGAGLTGISAASHCVGHGCDVKIFESRSKEKGLGGIWSVSLLQPLTYCHVDTNLRSASIRRQRCRCTVSCTDFTPQSNGRAHTLPRSRSEARSSTFGNAITWRIEQFSTFLCN